MACPFSSSHSLHFREANWAYNALVLSFRHLCNFALGYISFLISANDTPGSYQTHRYIVLMLFMQWSKSEFSPHVVVCYSSCNGKWSISLHTNAMLDMLQSAIWKAIGPAPQKRTIRCKACKICYSSTHPYPDQLSY
jgi:hypothetical protein